MRIKLSKKILSILCVASMLTFSGISAEAVKVRPLAATIGTVETVDRCDQKIDLIKKLICDSNLKSQIENLSKHKSLIEDIEDTLEPLESLHVNNVNEAMSLKRTIYQLHDSIFDLKKYFNQANINEEETKRNINKIVIRCAAVGFVKTKIWLNAEALDMMD